MNTKGPVYVKSFDFALRVVKLARWLQEEKREFVLSRQVLRSGTASCNTDSKTIRINSELGKKDSECLEYIVVHEMVHLIERSHNDRFRSLMDKYYPKWSHVRAQLNRAPLAHVEWSY
jgi:predicted metal-dependent hydrolase